MSTPDPIPRPGAVTIGIVGLRAAALALALGGQTRASESLYLLADLAVAGQNVDQHMELVAEKLKSRGLALGDWEDVYQRISADRDRLHAPPA